MLTKATAALAPFRRDLGLVVAYQPQVQDHDGKGGAESSAATRSAVPFIRHIGIEDVVLSPCGRAPVRLCARVGVFSAARL